MATEKTQSTKGIGKSAMSEVAIVSELKELGWQVKKNEKTNQYFAQELAGEKRSIGPAASSSALKTQVNLASGPPAAKAGNGKAAKANGNGKAAGAGIAGTTAPPKPPEQRLPSMEEPAIDELNTLGDTCIESKELKKQATTKFKDDCDLMREKMRTHGRKRYNRRGFSIVIEESEKLVIKKDTQAPPMNPSTKTGSGKK